MAHTESRLKNESSPVSWHAWGEEAFEAAKEADKAILLSIGYSACHLCEEMDREFFGSAEVAAKLNSDFICIKVDRDERPDLDALYMTATLALSGRGGWPVTVFLDEKAEVFFAVPFFSETGREGVTRFSSLLERVSSMWSDERQILRDQAKELNQHIRASRKLGSPGGISEDSIRAACIALARDFDPSFGGFGRSSKVPPCAALSLLLRYHRGTGRADLLEMVTKTLDAMMMGGIYDHLGGAFFRLSVDRKWSVPRFEKMLGDNAVLASLYIEAYELTGYAPYRRIAEETLDFFLREMRAPEGGFFSSVSASLQGREGESYLWTQDQVRSAVEEPGASYFCEFFGVSEEGNFRGKSVLSIRRSLSDVAGVLRLPEAALFASLEDARAGLLEAREARPIPEIDDSVVAGWNGLMIRALASASLVFEEPRYLEAAKAAGSYLLASAKSEEGMSREDGGLFRIARSGRAPILGQLEDYAFSGEGFLRLFEAGGGAEFLEASVSLAEKMLGEFSGEGQGALFSSASPASDPMQIYGRCSEGRDGPLGNDNASAALLLARLAVQRGSEEWRVRAQHLVQDFASSIRRDPRSHCSLLSTVDFLFSLPVKEGASRRYRARELGRGLLPGRATSEATASLKRKSPLGVAAYSSLGELSVSRLALGSYRIGLDISQHRETVREALLAGVNLVDTSPSFALGDSERLLGEVLSELSEAGKVVREQVVILSKVGLALGSEAEYLAARKVGEPREGEGETGPRFCVPLGQSKEGDRELLAKGAFCLDADFIKRQIDGSLQRLGLDHLDLCLIQSPEHFLKASKSREELKEALGLAFTALEEEVAEGRIGAYGILCTTLVAGGPEDQALDLGWILDIAQSVRPEGHHLRVLELPVNLVERAALLPRGSGSEEGPSLIQEAVSAGLFVLAVRPLSTFVGGASLRLIDPPKSTDGGSSAELQTTRYRVASLEAEFETTFAVSLRLKGGVNQGAILPMSGALGKALEQVSTREQFDLAETTLVTPQLRHLIGQLDQTFAGPGQKEWEKFRGRYIEAVGAWLASLREKATDENRRILAALEEELRAGSPTHTWAQRALSWVMESQGVGALCVGLRHPNQLKEALALFDGDRR